jgi:two-component system LytT family sensor kinase
VAGSWLLVAVVLGAQSALQANLQGESLLLTAALRTAFIQTAPWIPVTLAVVWLAVRFPVTGTTWRRNVWIHLGALPVVAFVANVLVVLGFWISSGTFGGLGALVRGGLFWASMRIHVAALVYAAIAAATQGIVYYREARARELHVARLEGQLARARLQALNAQIRPHFLFNTLHTMGQLWRTGRNEEAEIMLDRLGSLFQRVRATRDSAEVALLDELDLVREYLAIESMRFPDRLRVSVDASPEAEACRIPPLLLQPLVENAVRHGISASSAAGRVEVRARVSGGRLEIDVVDDGPGLDAPSPSPGSGTGLTNTRERLVQLYGDGHRMELVSPATGGDRGTRVHLEIPARAAWPHDGPGAREPADSRRAPARPVAVPGEAETLLG